LVISESANKTVLSEPATVGFSAVGLNGAGPQTSALDAMRGANAVHVTGTAIAGSALCSAQQ